MATALQPWWTLTKRQQKHVIELTIDRYLSENGNLTNRQRFRLGESLSFAHRGLFGLSATALLALRRADDDDVHVDPAAVRPLTPSALKGALGALRRLDVQDPPVFRMT
jgi:hypothetical protein